MRYQSFQPPPHSLRQTIITTNETKIPTNKKSSSLAVGAPLNPGAPLSVGSPLSVGFPLCEDGRAYVTDPVTGRQMCMCSLGVGTDVHFPHLNMSHEARKQGALSASGGSPHCLGYDTSAFCSPVIRGLPIRPDRMPPYLTTGIPGHSMSFDPALAGHPYGLLYQGMDMNGPMRKAATRETTGPLKAWLSEHKKNPYPTKAEKIMLAIITRMTLTQVSTWFANARRRLKKENKLYPGDRESRPDDDYDDEDDDMDSQKDGSGPHRSGSDKVGGTSSDNEDINVDDSDEIVDDDAELILDKTSVRGFDPRYLYSQGPGRHLWPSSGSDISTTEDSAIVKDSGSDRSSMNRNFEGPCTPVAESSSKNSSTSKPKIWSISEIIGTSEPKQTSATAQAQPSVYGTKPIPPLVISSPFMHLSSSHMNPSPLLSTFSSSLASHRFHHQLAGMSGLYFPVNDPQLTLVPPGFAVDVVEHSDRRLYNGASLVDKHSTTDSRHAMNYKKELSDTSNGLEHSRTHKSGSSTTPETASSKFDDSFGKTDSLGKGVSGANSSELLSPHSSKSNRIPISPDITPPHTPILNQDRSSYRDSPERQEMSTVTNRIFNSPQKNSAVKSEKSRHGENALNLHKTKTSEN